MTVVMPLSTRPTNGSTTSVSCTGSSKSTTIPTAVSVWQGDSGAVAEPIADPSAGKLSGGAADKDQRQCESRSRDSRPLSDQQEWQAHKKAASHDAVCDAEQDENAKAELP